jgi:hypothetical protein
MSTERKKFLSRTPAPRYSRAQSLKSTSPVGIIVPLSPKKLSRLVPRKPQAPAGLPSQHFTDVSACQNQLEPELPVLFALSLWRRCPALYLQSHSFSFTSPVPKDCVTWRALLRHFGANEFPFSGLPLSNLLFSSTLSRDAPWHVTCIPHRRKRPERFPPANQKRVI